MANRTICERSRGLFVTKSRGLDHDYEKRLQTKFNNLGNRNMLHSSIAADELGDLLSDELRKRAELAWQSMKRSIEAGKIESLETLASDLSGEIKLQIRMEEQRLQDHIQSKLRTMILTEHIQSIERSIGLVRNTTLSEIIAEINLYVDTLRNIHSDQFDNSLMEQSELESSKINDFLMKWIARIKKHHAATIIFLLIAVVIYIATVTDSIDKIISFKNKYFPQEKEIHKAHISLPPIEIKDFDSVNGSIEKAKDPLGKDIFICRVGSSLSEGYYFGKYIYNKREIGDHYELSVSMQDVVDVTTLELVGLSVHFAISPEGDAFFFYDSKKFWTKWKKLSFNLKSGMKSLMIKQNGKVLEGYVNGEQVQSFNILEPVPKKGRVALFFKARSKDGTMHFKDFMIRDLEP